MKKLRREDKKKYITEIVLIHNEKIIKADFQKNEKTSQEN